MRQFAVIGLGRFGTAIARRLAKNGCEVLAIDKNADRVQELRDVVDAAVIGDATDRKVLEQLRLTEVDEVVVCMGEQMEESIMTALHLVEMGIKRLWSKASSEAHARILNRLGVENTILPERDTANRLADRLSFPNLLEFVPLTAGYSIIQLACPREMVGKSLRDLDLRVKHGVQVLAVREGVPDRITMAPGGDFVVKDSDVLTVLGPTKALEKLAGKET